jgi:hypothetical protein
MAAACAGSLFCCVLLKTSYTKKKNIMAYLKGESRVRHAMDRTRHVEVDARAELETAQAVEERLKAKKKARNVAYRAANRDKMKVYYAAYRAANSDKRKAYRAAYRAANPDKMKANNAAYRAANKEKLKANNAAYRAANKEKLKAKYAAYHAVYRAANRDNLKANDTAYRAAYRAANRDKMKAYFKRYKREKLGCVKCKHWPIDSQMGHKKYDGYCFRCFKEEFPDDTRTKNRARAELMVREYINSKWTDFVHDHVIETAHCACTHRRRVDHRKLVGNTLICIETDEWWHRNYDKDDEDARYHDIMMTWGGKLLFIRINPDGKGPPIEKRLEKLGTAIEVHLKRIEAEENTSILEVWHLYYPPGTPNYYDESVVPGWLEAWQSVHWAASPVEHALEEPMSICAEYVCEAGEKESDMSPRPRKRPFLEPAARVEHETEDGDEDGGHETEDCDEDGGHETEDGDEDNPYNIDVDWVPVRAVPVMSKRTVKEADIADTVEAPAPPRWVPWAPGEYDPDVHGCSSGSRKNTV